MARISAARAGGANVLAFLDMIAFSELGPKLMAKSDGGYNVIVGGSLFATYKDHPRRSVKVRPGLSSTAAGRYQLLARYFDAYKRQLGLRDFSPESQDLIAIQQIREQHALDLINAGKFAAAVAACRNIWASLPGAGYGQHENDIETLRVAYVSAGGSLAA